MNMKLVNVLYDGHFTLMRSRRDNSGKYYLAHILILHIDCKPSKWKLYWIFYL